MMSIKQNNMHDDFFHWLNTWIASLPSQSLNQLGDSKKIAIVSVDMVVGFCHKGSLASDEVKSIIPNVVDVFKKAKKTGIQHFLLVQDAHHHDATEFSAYPPHCVKGSDEAQTIPELQELPFAKQFTVIEKNSLSPAYETTFDIWIEMHPEVDTFIVLGDCTDLCIYSMAMHLRLFANALNKKRNIIVPANAVATYNMTIEQAQKIGALPHPANLIHPLFLYHMTLNGIEVLKEIQ